MSREKIYTRDVAASRTPSGREERLGLDALEKVARDAQDAALPFVAMLNELRREEGDSVTLLCDNPEGPPNNAVECCGDWTDWKDRRFSGETLRAAVRAAFDARTAASPPISLKASGCGAIDCVNACDGDFTHETCPNAKRRQS